MSGISKHPLRFAWRLAQFLWLLIAAGCSFIFAYWLTGRARSYRGRCQWLQRWANFAVRIFGTAIELRGEVPAHGLIVSNHLSYLDIFVLAAVQPTVFVSKADVASWPVFGWFAKIAGTLFLKREQRGDVARIADQLKEPISENLAVVMFLEGTSTAGDRVLPFRSSLLDPAVENGWPVTPIWIGYHMTEGSVEDEVAYWRDMTLFPHMMNLISKSGTTAQIAFGKPLPAGHDRKELAQKLHSRTCELASLFDRHLPETRGHKRPAAPH